MPLLEVIQTRQISASIRMTDTTAAQVDQYAAFIRACADDVVEQAPRLCVQQRPRLPGLPQNSRSSERRLDVADTESSRCRGF